MTTHRDYSQNKWSERHILPFWIFSIDCGPFAEFEDDSEKRDWAAKKKPMAFEINHIPEAI